MRDKFISLVAVSICWTALLAVPARSDLAVKGGDPADALTRSDEEQGILSLRKRLGQVLSEEHSWKSKVADLEEQVHALEGQLRQRSGDSAESLTRAGDDSGAQLDSAARASSWFNQTEHRLRDKIRHEERNVQELHTMADQLESKIHALEEQLHPRHPRPEYRPQPSPWMTREPAPWMTR